MGILFVKAAAKEKWTPSNWLGYYKAGLKLE